MNVPPIDSSFAALNAPHGKVSKLHEAAQQFESLMINEMLKAAKESSFGGLDGDGGDAGQDSAMEMAQGQFAAALARNGGLGLTHMIERAVGPQPAQNEKSRPNILSAGSASNIEPK